MKATSRPPAPALCATRPGGLPVWAILMTAFSLSLSCGPVRSVPPREATSGTDSEAVVPSEEYCTAPSWVASTPLRPAILLPVGRDLGLVGVGQPARALVDEEAGDVLHGDELVRLVGDLGRLGGRRQERRVVVLLDVAELALEAAAQAADQERDDRQQR